MRIHFLGSEGASIKRLMEIAKSLGFVVSGSDVATTGHKKEFVWGSDLVVYTAAVGDDNCEILEAKKLGIKTIERSEFLGYIASKFDKTIAISGTHGKTSVTGMIASIFENQDVCVHIGGDCYQKNGKKEFFLTEACEYKRSFLTLKSTIGVILNVELDHTDYFRDLDDYVCAYIDFANKSKMVIVNGDDLILYDLSEKYNYIRFGLNNKNDYTAVNILEGKDGIEFDFVYKKATLCNLKVPVYGRHNLLNAIAAAAVSHIAGLCIDEIKDGLEGYKGVKRRLEYLGNKNGARIYSDYAHHPQEISCLINAIKQKQYKNFAMVFEPHTYTRTASLCNDFASSLSQADTIFLMPIFPSREKLVDGVTSDIIYKKLQNTNSYNMESYDKLFNLLDNDFANKFDAIVFCGAGTIDFFARKFAIFHNKSS